MASLSSNAKVKIFNSSAFTLDGNDKTLVRMMSFFKLQLSADDNDDMPGVAPMLSPPCSVPDAILSNDRGLEVDLKCFISSSISLDVDMFMAAPDEGNDRLLTSLVALPE